ncbi:intraflagellar transport protein 140 homolog isoform X2 [Daktulosphaira vitifoliae]|uniref:intraflagellar transport protein 140 homolog isoform X2 n=1 Tax=Daktulosphaira vitifoliae TaxID=58002 RepID=UPI0021AA7BC1|nr:intraflagellar transport protein 140 homolog isoform X2 [Daktulosphaira vitifoliae]
MSLYFDFKIKTNPINDVSGIVYHNQLSLLGVISYSSEKQCHLLICDEIGDELFSCYIPNFCRAIAYSWHPTQRTLAIGSEGGEICLWNGGSIKVLESIHTESLAFMVWSPLGGCLVSGDQTGIVVGWKSDCRGLLQLKYKINLHNILTKAISFRCGKPATDISNLAKLAVAGDQNALDIFSSWRPKTTSHTQTVTSDNLTFYCTSATGHIYYIEENGELNKVYSSNSPILKILCHELKDICVIVCDDHTLSHQICHKDGSLTEVSKIKLNGITNDSCVIWAGPSLLACTTNDLSIRFWDIESGNSYNLNAFPILNSSIPKQTFTSIIYSKEKGLCAATNFGNIIIWRFNEQTEDEWNIQGSCKINDKIKYCVWGLSNVAILAFNNIYILCEHELLAVYYNQVAITQTSATNLTVYNFTTYDSFHFDSKIQVFGIALTYEYVTLWNGKIVQVYNIKSKEHHALVGTFACDVQEINIYDRILIVAENDGKLQIRTFQGTIKQTLSIDAPTLCMALNNSYLAVITISGVIHVWDLNRREAKSICHPKDIISNMNNFGEAIQLRINSNGSKISFTAANQSFIPMPCLYIWDRKLDLIIEKNFENKNNKFNDTQFIVSHHWDVNEPHLLFCEARTFRKLEKKKIDTTTYNSISKERLNKLTYSSIILSMFYIEHKGVIMQDIITHTNNLYSLIGLDTPHYFVLTKQKSDSLKVDCLLMKEFEGIDSLTEDIRKAIMNFSYNLCLGDIDLAFDFISNINNAEIWTSLAKMCVKTKRIDVAEICLGHMKDCRGIAIIRSMSSEKELETKVAALAMHLGMNDEAEELLKTCHRYDLLNKFYRSCNQISASLSVAETKDRIHLRNTYYHVGRHLEIQGDITSAANMYCKAETQSYDIPRMLQNDLVSLENYIKKKQSPLLLKWWAQYLEGNNDMEGAIQYYKQAGDDLSTVRILCYLGNLEQAAQICMNSTDMAASCHLARSYEVQGLHEEAVKLYVNARAYINAIRLCKEQYFDENLWNIALLAGSKEKIDVAQYFELISPDKSIILYHQAGCLHKAIDLAFKCQDFDAISTMSQELNVKDDANLLVKCSTFFIDQGHYDNAVNLLAMADQYEEAIAQCQQHKVNITESLCERLTPSADHPQRLIILEKLADCALLQANYHMAAKKFTQAGHKIKAMKALLKSGDTDKVIFYANISRLPETYIMAANYLQSLDWQEHPDLLKTIITFYNKGKALDLLANFYVACAQLEVDEYRNYSKAVGALSEALKVLSKTSDQYKSLSENIAKNITLLKKFIDVKKQIEKGNGDLAMSTCRQILSASSLDIIRYGDVYSIMIEYYTAQDDKNMAIQLVNEFLSHTKKNDNLFYYIDKGVWMKNLKRHMNRLKNSCK